MTEQTVATRLTLDASQYRKEMQESAKVTDQLSGRAKGAGQDIDRALSGIVGSAGNAEKGIRSLDDRIDLLTGVDREVVLRANIARAEQGIREIDRMLADPSLNDVEIRVALDKRNAASRAIEDLKGQLDELGPAAAEAGEEIERGLNLGAIGGALGSAAVADRLNEAVTSSGQLRAQLGLTTAEAREFDQVAKDVYRDNFGDSMGEAAQVTGMVHQALGLVGGELESTTKGIFSVSDAFEHLGADQRILLEDVRAMKANFPGTDEARSLDLIAWGFQNGVGSAGDLQDTLQEYPGDFARIGLTADDMLGILNVGMQNGARNTDIVADAIREMGIRISTAGDTGQQALAKLFPAQEAQRLIADLTAGGEAGRAAFYAILDGLAQVEDPQRRYNLAVEIMGTRGEELANILPGMADGLADVAHGAIEAGGAAESTEAQYSGFRNTLEGLVRYLETSVIGSLGGVGVGVADTASNVGIAVLGFKALKDVLPAIPAPLDRIGRSLGGIALKAGGYVLAGQGVAFLGNAIADLVGYDNDLSNLSNELELLALTGQETGGLASAAGGIDGIVRALDGLKDPSLADNIGAGVSRGIDTVGQVLTLGALNIRGTAHQMEEELSAVDDALASMASSGNAELAADLFEMIADAADQEGISLAKVTAAFPGYNTALDLAAARGEDLPGPTSEAAEAIDGVAGSADEATTALQNYLAATQALFDPVWAVQDAQQNLAEAQKAVTEAQADGKVSAEELARLNGEAVRAAAAYEGALANLRTAVDTGEVSQEKAIETLNRWVAQGHITQEQADETAWSIGVLSDTADSVTDNIPIKVTASGIDTTLSGLDAVLGRLRSISGTAARVALGRVFSFGGGHAQGGLVGFASGGAVGAYAAAPGGTDTVPAMLTPGEFVLRKGAVDRLGVPLLSWLNAAEFAGGGLVAGEAALARLGADTDFVSSTLLGGGVTLDAKDPEAKAAALRSLAESYRDLADAIGEAQAAEILNATSSLDNFKVMADAAKGALKAEEDAYQQRREINDNLYELGLLSTEDHLFNLGRRQEREVQYSDEWTALENERLAVMRGVLDEEQRIEDARFQLGEISNSQYLGLLRSRLAATEKYSQDYMSILREIQSMEAQVVSDQSRLLDYQYELGEISTDAYLGSLKTRLSGLEKYSDEYMSVWRQIERIEQDAVRASEQAASQAASAASSAASEAARAAEEAADAAQRAFDAIADPIRQAGDLIGAFSGQLTVSATDIESFFEHQIEGAKRWDEQLQQLRGQGLDEDFLQQLAGQGPKALGLASALGGMDAGQLNGWIGQLGAQASSTAGWFTGQAPGGGTQIGTQVTFAPGSVQLTVAPGGMNDRQVEQAIAKAFGTVGSRTKATVLA